MLLSMCYCERYGRCCDINACICFMKADLCIVMCKVGLCIICVRPIKAD